MIDNGITAVPVYRNLGVNLFQFPNTDRATQNVTYYGWARPNADITDECWRIMKETTANGVTKREYACGSDEFRFKWSERGNYTYSR